MKRLWRTIKVVGLLLATVVFVPVIFALIVVAMECRVFSKTPAHPDTPLDETQPPAQVLKLRQEQANYLRSEDQTYLTVPEWYIVYSADEYADFTAKGRPSHYPYFGAIRQFWGTYYDVCGITREQYTLNSGYHVVLAVFGTSFTVDNVIRGIYENTVGRDTEWLSSGGQTEEDAYAHTVAEEYGTFLHTIPWYRFPYGEKLSGLWRETSWWGPNVIRKWERKFALSVEYGVKSVYAKVIGAATGSAYSPDELKIQAWASGVTPALLEQQPEVEVIEDLGDQSAVVQVPRYEEFTQLVPKLAAEGMQFKDIGGNDEILITIIAPNDWTYDLEDGTVVLEMPILTQPPLERVGVNVPVSALSRVLNELAEREIQFEHAYDY